MTAYNLPKVEKKRTTKDFETETMVGKDSMPLSCSSKDRNENGSYSRRKKERKTKFQTETENTTSDPDYMSLVDSFVQDVIERAKVEYLSGCANGGIEISASEANSRLNIGKFFCVYI